MQIRGTNLSFKVFDGDDCKSFAILDTSYYNSAQNCGGATLQVRSPFSSQVVELDYLTNAITVLNSNNLGITNSWNEKDLQDLPDGLYTAKISICPHDKFWYEKSWYRTCKLECKYKQAVLKLGLSECNNCLDPKIMQDVKRAFLYIQGVKANTSNANLKKSADLYKAADRILEKIVGTDCNCS